MQENKNIFMMCNQINKDAYSKKLSDFSFRKCKLEEFDFWKNMQFDTEVERKNNDNYMNQYYENVYCNKETDFFDSCIFVCSKDNKKILGTGFLWKAYGQILTIHWIKTIKEYEGLGIGRALLTYLTMNLKDSDYPILLHTQAGSFKAIKLYSDFGFKIALNEYVGNRKNEFEDSQLFLENNMNDLDFKNLTFSRIPENIIKIIGSSEINEF